MNHRKFVLLLIMFSIIQCSALASGKTIIQPGGTFFLGEGTLDVVPAFYGGDFMHSQTINWFSTLDPNLSRFNISSALPSPPPEILSDYVAIPADWPQLGAWYRGTCIRSDMKDCTLAFYVLDPVLDISVINAETGTDISGKSVFAGTPVRFIIRSNLYKAARDPHRIDPALSAQGFIDIKILSPSGEFLTSVPGTSGKQENLTGLFVDTNPYMWGNGGAWDTGTVSQSLPGKYPPGAYTVWAESTLNQMKENYPDPSTGGVFIGKTASMKKTILIEPPQTKSLWSDPVFMRIQVFQQIISTIKTFLGLV